MTAHPALVANPDDHGDPHRGPRFGDTTTAVTAAGHGDHHGDRHGDEHGGQHGEEYGSTHYLSREPSLASWPAARFGPLYGGPGSVVGGVLGDRL